MNSLVNPLKSALDFFATFFGVIILAIVLGVLGSLIHEYLAITLFFITFIVGVAGAIKLYLTPQSTSQLL